MFTSNQQNKDLCELKSNTSSNASLEANSDINDTVVMFDRCVTFKAKKSKGTGASNTLNINDLFSFGGAKSNLDNEDVLVQTSEVAILRTEVEEHNCGSMNNSCSFCGALHFEGESNASGFYKSCCYFGKVRHQESREYPKELRDLMVGNDQISKSFKASIRSYNSALSFASMGAKIDTITNGPYCFKIHGQVYHSTYNLYSINDSDKKYSQLYVVDTEEATELRLKNLANSKCDATILKELDIKFREVNPYSAAFKSMGEVVEEKRQEGHMLEDISIFFNKDIKRDVRRYNSPTASEIAMVFTDPNGEPPFERDLRVYTKGRTHDNVQLSLLSPHLDPMTYVLFFPYGESGWQPNLMLRSYKHEIQRISLLQYKVTQLAIREDKFNPLLYGGKLLQQWIVDSYLQVEANNLNFIRLNQKQLRIAQYKGLMDFVNNNGSDSSIPVILPSSFQGSPRNMRERYHDAMSIVTKYGKPDLFITFTCNPNWKEIKDNLLPGQTPSDRPDLVARVYSFKLKSLMDDLVSGKVAGDIVAHVYSIEFQKRGLPHAHILVILKNKISTIERIDQLVCAEIPDPIIDKDLHSKVIKHMIHGPCGLDNLNSPCMESGFCAKDYPKEYNEKTSIPKDGYPIYRRRKGPSYKVKNCDITNINVIPYNKFLLAKYNSHINVEVCTSIKSVKYIFKYIYKGYDYAEMRITDNNEIDQFVNSRYVSAPEAMWRLLENKMHGRSHKIIRLPVHLDKSQLIYYEEGKEVEAKENGDIHQTQLLAWFELNKVDPEARKLLYSEIPLHYTYNKGIWRKKRRISSKIITRLYAVSPVDKERFDLRILLLNVKGARSFEELKSYKDIIYQTNEEAVEARGLLLNDNEWDRVLEEAASTETPSNIRNLFGYICSFNQPKSPAGLFEKYFEDMVDDLKEEASPRNKLLQIIKSIVNSHGWTMQRLGLPEPLGHVTDSDLNISPIEDISNIIGSLNDEQRAAFEEIVGSIDKGGKLFFLDGPAGSGKTYLYNAIINYLKSHKKKTIQMATTGIAADLLENGRTVHSCMKLPVPLNETSISRLQKSSPEAAIIKEASLILIDEVSMMSKYALDAIDTALRRICDSSDIFGGKTILLGGDFRQAAPVVLKGTQVSIIENSIISARSWRHVNILRLSNNMRSINQHEFSSWLLEIGNGSFNDMNGEVLVPKKYLIDCDIVESIFGKGDLKKTDESVFSKVVLTTKNEYANHINDKVLSMLKEEEVVHKSADSILSDDPNEQLRFPIEFLNKQQPSGLPQHELRLRVGCLIMLLRNIDPKNGLLNGTRLQVLRLKDNFIVAEIISGRKKGFITAIPRIDMMPSDTLLAFVLKRRQFPVIVSYAMTIHKSQGQSFDNVGVYLPEPVFSHGQFYVAVSRVRNPENLKIFLSKDSKGLTKNIVYKELLQGKL